MEDQTRIELEAAAFRGMIGHLQKRTDVQNIDVMNLAGFCRNCLSKWYAAAAEVTAAEAKADALEEELEELEGELEQHDDDASAKSAIEKEVVEFMEKKCNCVSEVFHGGELRRADNTHILIHTCTQATGKVLGAVTFWELTTIKRVGRTILMLLIYYLS